MKLVRALRVAFADFSATPGRALKNQNAAPASPPCTRRRRRSAPLLFKSSYPHFTAVLLLDIPKSLGTAH